MWGTAMDISADQAGNWAAKWEQSFSMNHDQIMEIADVINYLGNNYATTAAEIAESVNEAASMGQISGVDPKATAAIAASMQAMGVSADVTGTTIKRIYTNINKGSMATANQEAAFNRLGMTAEGVAAAMQVDGTGTLLQIFEAIGNLPGDQKLSTLNALFGQWAIEGGAKVTQNLDLLKEMLAAVNDPSAWTGSMEKEFIIKATTPEAIDTMLGNAASALKADLGEAFLPAYKAFGHLHDRLHPEHPGEYAAAGAAVGDPGRAGKQGRGAAGTGHEQCSAIHPEGTGLPGEQRGPGGEGHRRPGGRLRGNEAGPGGGGNAAGCGRDAVRKRLRRRRLRWWIVGRNQGPVHREGERRGRREPASYRPSGRRPGATAWGQHWGPRSPACSLETDWKEQRGCCPQRQERRGCCQNM